MIAILELNTANYDDHLGWMDRLQFIVDTILGVPNGQGHSPGGDNVKADIVCLSEIRYTYSNSFYQYADTYWKSKDIVRPSPSTDTMADMIIALLDKATGIKWNIYTQEAMCYTPPPNASWEGLSIISHLPLSETGYFEMPGTDTNQRITQYATVAINDSTNLTVYNTHFALDADDRSANATLVVDTIKQQAPAQFVLAGDFNAEPTEDCITTLTEAGFTDLWATYSGYPADSPAGYTFAAANLTERIDYIFASSNVKINATSDIGLVPPFDPQDIGIGRSKSGTVFASDHLGLWANIELGS